MLEGHRFTPSELLGSGLVDIVVDGGSEAVLTRASELAQQWSVNARTGVWGLIKVGICLTECDPTVYMCWFDRKEYIKMLLDLRNRILGQCMQMRKIWLQGHACDRGQ